MRVKSSAINRRWLATRAGLDPSRVIFVVRACSACQKPYAIIRLRSSKRQFSLRVHSQDDDRKNVEEVATHCPGVTCHQVVEPRGGMDERDCEAVLRWLEALPPPPPPAAAD
jgi:hypothetical protein